MTALADVALSDNKPCDATAWLEQSHNKNPDTLEPAVTLVNHYIRFQEHKKALTLAQKLRSTHPEKTDVLELLARAQLASDDKNAALDSYNKLSGMLPDSSVAPVQFRIATLHMAMKNEAAASDALKKSLSAKPDHLDAALAQAMLEARKGNHEQAITMATQIQSQHEKSPTGHMLEGDIRMGQKKPEFAAKAYEQAFKLSKSGSVLIKIHAALDAAGKKEEANARLLQWLKENPSDMQARLYLAGTYLANKQNKVAIEQYQIILKQDPKYVPALNNIATLYQQEKHPDALAQAEKAYQLAPENPAVLDTLGWILVEQGKSAKAVPLLQKAVSLVPTAVEIRYHLAVGLMQSGDKTKARKELEQVLAAGKEFSEEISKAQALMKQME
jgi:putative PEP-CTERM system TPR-repeat lipoprotein